jgi:hypothetical protein
LIGFAFGLSFFVSGSFARPFFRFAFRLFGGALDAIFVNNSCLLEFWIDTRTNEKT